MVTTSSKHLSHVPSSIHVLLIEDNDDLRTTMSDLLRSWGHRVDQAATGEDGLRLLREKKPDLALIDIGLPDVDGCRVAERARADGLSGTLLIALTGYTQPDDFQRVTEAGFDEMMYKPPDLVRLRTICERCATIDR